MAGMEKSSKPDEWLHNKCSFMTESLYHHCLSIKSRNSKVFTHTGILSLNVKKLISLHLVWNKIQKLQWGSLFFITPVMLVGIWSESLPKHGSTIIKSFLGIVLSTLILFLKIILYICQWSHVDFKSTVLKWSFENHQVMQSHLDSKQYRS